MFIKKGHKISTVLKYAGVSSSSWYYHLQEKGLDKRRDNPGRPVPGYTVNPDGEIIPDALIINALKSFRDNKNFSNGGGYYKLSEYLRRDFGYYVNDKKVYRLCKEHGLLLPKKKKNRKRKSKICTNMEVSKPNQLWELDIKYGYIYGEDRFFYIMIIIDVYLRLVVGYHIGLRCTGKDLAFTLNNAIKKHCPDPESISHTLYIRSDNGTQMTSNAFIDSFKAYGEKKVVHELIPPATPNKNAHVESFNSILEIEFMQPRYFWSYEQAYAETVDFINFYNNERIHGALNNNTPNEMLMLAKKGKELNIKNVRA